MTGFVKTKIEVVVDKIKKNNPREKDTVKVYVQRIMFECVSCKDEAVLYAIRQYELMDLYDKPVNYFIKIVLNYTEEMKKLKAVQGKKLGSVPGILVDGN